MHKGDSKTGRKKAVEALGCLLYVVAFLVMGAVLVSKWGEIFN